MAIATHDSTDGHNLVLGDVEDQPNCTLFRDTSGTAMIFNTPSGDAYKFGIGNTAYFTIGTTGIGYPSGSGDAETQGSGSGKATGVTINTPTGVITMDDAALAAGAEVNFVVTNSSVAITDTIVLSIQSGGTPSEYFCQVTTVAAGSFQIALANLSASSAEDAVVINYAVIKGVSS